MKKLWGSRFKKGTDPLADKFSFSIYYDKKLAIYDVIGSIAHARMLGKCNIIPKSDAKKIIAGLKKIGDQIDKGTFNFDLRAEDIHTNIQNSLKKMVGGAADKLHTARSRNDQIVLDIKLYCLHELDMVVDLITDLQKSILSLAKKNIDVIIPAYTHMQPAQVVLLAHHLLAYIEMLERDKNRLMDTALRTDSMPLGSCALSGTTLPTNRKMLQEDLGFISVTKNSIDSVSDRDFVIDAIATLSILAMHCSRIAEDLIIWNTKEFNYVDIDWGYCTGSSIMPHKKNPDILELIRAETGNIFGNLNKILTLTKGLPLAYNRDLQLDKPPLFESFDKIEEILPLLDAIFKTLKVNKAVLQERIKDETLFSVDLMEYLIKKGLSYREAHDIMGKMVRECIDEDMKISELNVTKLKKYSPKFEKDVLSLLNAKASVNNKKSFGSTNPSLVKEQIRKWEKSLNA